MRDIGGVGYETYRRLGPEDQQAIRGQTAQQPAPARSAAQPQQADPPQPMAPAQAETPQTAVAAIHHGLPVPDLSDMPAGMPSYALQATYEGRATTFNQTRQREAEAALERFAPQLGDFDGLNPATAQYEYQQAVAAFNGDPYVRELQRIATEAGENPADIPAYLTTTGSGTDVQAIPLPQARGILSLLGVELPANATPDQIASGYEILASMPGDLLATVINPGATVNFNGTLGGVGTPSFIPAGAQASARIEGEVALSDVQTGVNFEQTRQFEAYVQTTGEVGVDFGRTPLNKLYKWANRLNVLSPGAQQLVEGSPLLRNVVKGLPLPVSFAYNEFAGTRLSYEAVVMPDQGELLADGDMSGLPNPLDPLNMPTGTSVLIRGQSLTGSHFEASYKAFTLASDHVELDGMGFGVHRLEGSVVEVYAGPVETVENATFFGLGRPGFSIGINSEFSTEERSMQIARIDLSTAEGQAAYQQFMSSGQVPGWSPPGVQAAGRVDVFNAEAASSLGLNLGPISWQTGENASELTVTQTHWQDGTVEQQNTYVSSSGLTTDIRFPLDASGQPVDGQTEWTIVRADYNATSTSSLNDSFTGAMNSEFDGDQHVQLTFTTADLMALRERARASVVELQGQEKLDNLDSGVESAWWASTDERLAVAQTPDEVFAVLSDEDHDGTVADGLLALSFESGKPTPGTITIRDAG